MILPPIPKWALMSSVTTFVAIWANADSEVAPTFPAMDLTPVHTESFRMFARNSCPAYVMSLTTATLTPPIKYFADSESMNSASLNFLHA